MSNSQISSLSNPLKISTDNFKFLLDTNQSIPDIVNSNNNQKMSDSNAFVSNNCNIIMIIL